MSHIKSALKRIFHITHSIEATIISTGLCVTTLLMFGEVVNRYLGFGIIWLFDLALYIFIFTCTVAFIAATWQEIHIKVDVFEQHVLNGKPRALSLYRVLVVFLVIAGVCIFIPMAYEYMVWSVENPQYGTLVPWFNTAWLRSAFFFAFVLMLIHLLRIASRDVSYLRKMWFSKSHE